ncbi:MAG: UDP-N-acetylmuramoyl-L-alanyl-D-glutamate--2,6-diaminopimelate ligase [Verrucomicrobiota bacterium]
MNLGKLVSLIRTVSVKNPSEAEVSSICFDSRAVKPGAVFVALSGEKTEGAKFAADAIARGAVAVVSESVVECTGAALVIVENAREALADLASSFYGRPSDALKIAGITGTNGKTTTAFLLQHICDVAQMRCGLIGTVHYKVGDRVLPAVRTTPESSDIQELLGKMRDAGCRTVAMEVSSHALSQGRVRNVEFDVAVFTNLTQDHLDYHRTMDAYYEAKSALFLGMDMQRFKRGKAVINTEDRYGALLYSRLQQAGIPAVSYGFGVRCDFRASNVRSDVQGTSFQLDASGRSWLVRLPLIGTFNVLNALAAIAAAHNLGVDLRTAVLALASAPPVPGRLEPVPGKRSFRVFVDYAHTDDALKNVLRTIRELKPKRTLVVFGCGGDRDRSKRPLMGAVAEEFADWAIVTSDNPRSEKPEAIVSDIVSGMRYGRYEVVLDRKAAIQRAVELAGPRDIVLIAGKGHEATQETAGRSEPFSDLAVAQSALDGRPSDFAR